MNLALRAPQLHLAQVIQIKIAEMARLLSSADSSWLVNESTDISRSIINNDEDNEGVPHRVSKLEQEMRDLETELHELLSNQQNLRQGLQPRCA